MNVRQERTQVKSLPSPEFPFLPHASGFEKRRHTDSQHQETTGDKGETRRFSWRCADPSKSSIKILKTVTNYS